MQCPHCGADNTDEAIRCANCSSMLTPTANHDEGPIGSLPPGPVNLMPEEPPTPQPDVPAPAAAPVPLEPEWPPYPSTTVPVPDSTPEPVTHGSVPLVPPPPVGPAGYPSATTQPSNMPVIVLILGILSLVCGGAIAGIVALILGTQAKKDPTLAPNQVTMVNTGMILGGIGTVLSCLGVLFYLAMFIFAVQA